MTESTPTVPMLDVTPQDITNLVDELRDYHAISSPLFQRREQRDWAQTYLHGLLLDLERKSVEPSALTLCGPHAKTCGHCKCFVNAGAWDDDRLLQRHWQDVNTTLGDEDGVLLLDGSDFPKKGTQSVGVQRQYCGQLGKRANCQAGVFLGYASAQGATLLDRRLYLPQSWVNDLAFAARRQQCGIPADVGFQTKNHLGLEMIRAVVEAGTLRCRWLAADEAFGRDTGVRDAVADLGLWYFVDVPHDTRIWATATATTPQTVAAQADAVQADDWVRHTIAEGSKGPIIADIVVQRVHAVRDGQYHMTLVILAHCFLVRMHVRMKKSARADGAADAPAVDGSAATPGVRCGSRTGTAGVHPTAQRGGGSVAPQAGGSVDCRYRSNRDR